MKILAVLVDELPVDVKDCKFAHSNYEGVPCCDIDRDYCELLEHGKCSKLYKCSTPVKED